jgi:hypothetical protein
LIGQLSLPEDSVTSKLIKISPNFLDKVAQKAKISTSKPNLKVQNLQTFNKMLVETACLGEIWFSKK